MSDLAAVPTIGPDAPLIAKYGCAKYSTKLLLISTFVSSSSRFVAISTTSSTSVAIESVAKSSSVSVSISIEAEALLAITYSADLLFTSLKYEPNSLTL